AVAFFYYITKPSSLAHYFKDKRKYPSPCKALMRAVVPHGQGFCTQLAARRTQSPQALSAAPGAAPARALRHSPLTAARHAGTCSPHHPRASPPLTTGNYRPQRAARGAAIPPSPRSPSRRTVGSGALRGLRDGTFWDATSRDGAGWSGTG
ncbi:hypothetical protein Nmel_018545, partial [Mimus melanotis]